MDKNLQERGYYIAECSCMFVIVEFIKHFNN